MKKQARVTLGEEIYFEMRDWFTEKNGGEDLIHKGASSRKLKMQTKMVSLVKQNLKKHDSIGYDHFCNAIENALQSKKLKQSSIYGKGNASKKIIKHLEEIK